MPKIVLPVSMDDVELTSFDAVDPDTYDLEVNNVVQKIGADSKEPYLNVTYKIINHDEYAGHVIWDIISLQEQSLWKFKQFGLATGFDAGCEFDTEEMLGLTCQAVVDVEDGTKLDEDGNPIPRNVLTSYIYS